MTLTKPGDLQFFQQIVKNLSKFLYIVCKRSVPAKLAVKQLKLIDQLVASLNESVQNMYTIHKPTIYSESVVLNILKLLTCILEDCDQNKEYIMSNFNIYKTMDSLLN